MDIPIEADIGGGTPLQGSAGVLYNDPEAILDELQNQACPNLTSEGAVDDYIDQNLLRLMATTDRGERNILHCHAAKADLSSDRVYSVVKRLLQTQSDPVDMMSAMDGNDKIPLQVAIYERNYVWIQKMIKICSDLGAGSPRINWAALIDQPRAEGGNCLHAIITGSPKPSSRDVKSYYEVVNQMIDLAYTKSFRCMDIEHHTPLHLAVDTNRVVEGTVPVVQKLLARCDLSDLDEINTPGYKSPYQYFVEVRANWEENLKSLPVTSTNKPVMHHSRRSPVGLMGADVQPIKEQATSKRGDDSMPATLVFRNMQSPLDNLPAAGAGAALPTGYSTGGPGSVGMVVRNQNFNRLPTGAHALPSSEDGIAGRPSSSAAVSNSSRPRTPSVTIQAQRGIPTAQGSKRVQKEVVVSRRSEELRRKVSNDIKDILEVYYLQNLPTNTAIRLLYGYNTECKEISFDFFRGGRNVKVEAFTKAFGKLRFSSTLKHINLRNTSFINGVDSDGKVLMLDLTFFFKMLRDKGVRRILRLTIYDGTPGHSDDVIEECLRDFEVETLDWRKLELCLETSSLPSLKVNNLMLYWGGSNAVLRGWSVPGGLGSIKSLVKLNVMLAGGAHLTKRRKDDFETFRTKLNQGRTTPIEVSRLEEGDIVQCQDDQKQPTGGRPKHLPGPGDEQDGQKWLECMNKLNSAFRRVKKWPVPRPNSRLAESIKIAILDDGIDHLSEGVRGRVVGGATISTREWSKEAPCYSSTTGHGTLMASLVLRVFPDAELYSFRLEPTAVASALGSKAHHSFSYSTAIEAIDRATRCGVDIICMCWTVRRTERSDINTAMEQEFRNVISKAREKALLFCAVDDTGNDNPDYSSPGYPCRDDVIRIGAATELGTAWDHTNKEDANFLFPGRNVECDDGDSEVGAGGYYYGPEDAPHSHRVDGASPATALAAGLAGLILHFARISAIMVSENAQEGRYQGFLGPERYRELRNKNKMIRAFQRISTIERGNNFIKVWEKFNSRLINELKDDDKSDEEKWVAIAQTVQDLV